MAYMYEGPHPGWGNAKDSKRTIGEAAEEEIDRAICYDDGKIEGMERRLDKTRLILSSLIEKLSANEEWYDILGVYRGEVKWEEEDGK